MQARHVFLNLAIGLPLLLVAGNADAQPAAATDAEYTAKVMTAAPPRIVRNATIVRMEGSAMHILKKGTNGFTCLSRFSWVHA